MKIYKRTQNLLYTSAETSNVRFDLTDNFVEIAKRNIDNVSKKNGNLDLTLVYHQPHDEKEATKAAEKEACEKLQKEKSVKFVNVDENTLRGFVSDKKLKEQTSSTRTEKKDKSLIKTLIEFILAGLSFFAAIPSILTLIRDNKVLTYILLGCVIAVGAAFAVLSVLDLIKVVNRKKSTLNEIRQTVDIADAIKWNKEDFVYKSQNVVYVFFYTSASDILWQAFKKYLEYLPQAVSLSCVILKLSKNPTDDAKYFIELFNGNKAMGYAGDKAAFEQINKNKKARVFGYVLSPLSEEERRELVEELKSSNKHVSRGIANDGRDSLYRLVEQSENLLDETNYFNLVNTVYDSISDKSQLTVDGVKRILSFLATLNSILLSLPRNVNVAGGSKSDMFLSSKILQEINSECMYSNESSLKNTICLIWKGWQNILSEVAYREYSLLVSEYSEDWTLSPYKWAIESFLNYISYLDPNARNNYYYAAASEIQFIVEIIKSWHEVNNKSSMAGYFAANYLEIFNDVLRLNIANGLYCSNYDLLEFIQQTVFADTRATTNSELLERVNEFYVSDSVKAAFMQNAVVVPKISDNDTAAYVGNMSNKCREMHKAYLVERCKLSGAEYTVKQDVPSYFELFGTCENSAEYYSLLLANGEQCVLEFYSELYGICEFVANAKLSYFKYLKESGEVSDESLNTEQNRYNIVEKLSSCLFVEGQGELLKNMLSGVSSGEELLSCGLLNCDVFFLLHDLYLWMESAKQFVFSDNIASKSYNFIDDFICIEYVNNKDGYRHRFSNMFTDLVKLIAESGFVCFFAKYLLSIINYSGISDGNKSLITQYLTDNNKLQIDIKDNIQINNDDIRVVLEFCYGIKYILGIEKLKQICPFVKSLPSKGAFAEESDMFVKYVIYEEKPSFKGEAAKKKFTESLKTFSDDFCYLIFNAVRRQDASVLKYSYILADKLAKSTYTSKLYPLINSIEYLDEENKKNVMRTVVDNITSNIYDEGLLIEYNNFFVKYRSIIDELKREGYSNAMLENISTAVTALRYKKSLDLYYHLDKDAGFLFLYAKTLLEKMCMLNVKSSLGKELSAQQAYSQLSTIDLTFEDNGIKYISKEYKSVIDAIATGKIANVDDAAKLKIINDLIAFLDVDDRRITIDKSVKQKHKQLLASIRSRI